MAVATISATNNSPNLAAAVFNGLRLISEAAVAEYVRLAVSEAVKRFFYPVIDAFRLASPYAPPLEQFTHVWNSWLAVDVDVSSSLQAFPDLKRALTFEYRLIWRAFGVVGGYRSTYLAPEGVSEPRSPVTVVSKDSSDGVLSGAHLAGDGDQIQTSITSVGTLAALALRIMSWVPGVFEPFGWNAITRSGFPKSSMFWLRIGPAALPYV